MPAYISHAVMMEDLYRENKNDTRLFKIDLSLDELKTYALGADLASLSKCLIKDPHKECTRDFFLSMVNHVKRKSLQDNSHVLACLYGHVAHYFMDVCMHPFIFSIEKGCVEVGNIPNHHLIEGYIDAYLTEKILEKNIMEINENYFNKADLNIISVRDMLDFIYGEVYGDNNITKTYKKTINLFSMIEHLAKSGLFSQDFLISFSHFDKFMEVNRLSYCDLNNKNKDNYLNPVNGKMLNLSVLEMYYLSIFMTLNAFDEINKVLYYQKDLLQLEKVFLNLSYNTGLPCEMKDEMCYIKKR